MKKSISALVDTIFPHQFFQMRSTYYHHAFASGKDECEAFLVGGEKNVVAEIIYAPPPLCAASFEVFKVLSRMKFNLFCNFVSL